LETDWHRTGQADAAIALSARNWLRSSPRQHMKSCAIGRGDYERDRPERLCLATMAIHGSSPAVPNHLSPTPVFLLLLLYLPEDADTDRGHPTSKGVPSSYRYHPAHENDSRALAARVARATHGRYVRPTGGERQTTRAIRRQRPRRGRCESPLHDVARTEPNPNIGVIEKHRVIQALHAGT